MTNFFEDKKVLVTGGAGFVGSHLVELLIQADATVTVMDNFSHGKNRVDGAIYNYGSAGDVNDCLDAMENQQIVFNLAAVVAGVEYNQKNHSRMYYRNHRLLNAPVLAAQAHCVERFLQTSSVCVYGIEYNAPCVETNGMQGVPVRANEGYSWAKRQGERMATWAKDLHTVIVRPSNVYGPRDYFDNRAHVIPALIKKCLNDDEIIVNGSSETARQFIYVTDVAKGMMAAVEHGKKGEAYNIGSNLPPAITIGDLVEMIREVTGMTHKPIVWKDLFDSGDNVRWSDCSKAHSQLGWDAVVGMREGLRKTVEWYGEQENAN